MDYAPTQNACSSTGEQIVAVPICNGLRSYSMYLTINGNDIVAVPICNGLRSYC